MTTNLKDRARALVGLIAVILAIGIPLFARAKSNVFSKADLNYMEEQEPYQILVQPKMACFISSLMSSSHFRDLKENMQVGQLALPVDKIGGYVFPGHQNGRGGLDGIVVLRPDGAVWVGLVDGFSLMYFTNQPRYYRKLEPSILSWTKDDLLSPIYMSARSRPTVESEEAKCSDKVLGVALKKYYARKSGEFCDKKSTVSLTAKRVVPVSPARRAYFYDHVLDCKSGVRCFQKRHGYLITNDLVQIADKQLPKSGYRCVSYKSVSGRITMGWLRKDELQPIGDTKAAQGSPPAIPAWTGDWYRTVDTPWPAYLGISRDGDGVRVKGSAFDRQGGTNAINGLFVINGDRAKGVRDLDPDYPDDKCIQGVKLWHLNNSLYVSDDQTGCTNGFHATFEGAYYRKVKHSK